MAHERHKEASLRVKKYRELDHEHNMLATLKSKILLSPNGRVSRNKETTINAKRPA
jgi:hypothetical protein